MAYNWILQSTTTDASDMNDNFQAIGAGTRLPTLLTNTGAFYTDSVYDLGSSAKRWKTLYCNEIDANSIGSTWGRISTNEIGSNTNSLEITGLDGNVDIFYTLICRFIFTEQTTCNYNLFFASAGSYDSDTNYGSQQMRAESTTVAATRNTARSGIFLGAAASASSETQTVFSNSLIYAKTGYERPIMTDIANKGIVGKNVQEIIYSSAIWNNTTATITSMKIVADTTTGIGVGSYIELWARR